jgi:hypothetical protein
MRETFRVWLMLADQIALDGFWGYRSEALPEPNDIIVVENVLKPGDVISARVTRVTPDGDPPIHATQVEGS